MQTKRLKNSADPWFPAFNEIYRISFPIFEQRTESRQERAFACNRYHLDIGIENNRLIGFIGWWEFDDYLYIEHLAVHPEARGKKYGTLLLEQLKEKYARRIILEIDPVIDENSGRRLRFYRNLGFFENPYSHIHPPYRPGYTPHSLTVLSSQRPITEQEYQKFYTDLANIVMK